MIIEYLQNKYYSKTVLSKETSSHWDKYGKSQVINLINEKYKLSGSGFGDFVTDSQLNILLSFPSRMLIRYILRNSDPIIITLTRNIAKKHNRIFSYDMARMILTVEILKKNINLNNMTIAIIGDGYGILGTILKSLFPLVKIIFINLGRTLVFDVYYTQEYFPNHQHNLITNNKTNLSDDFNYIEAEISDSISICADLFINTVSMQEMNHEVIKKYFKLIRSQNKNAWFYCCNRIEKELPDKTRTNFFDYGWLSTDNIIFDELCPWQKWGVKNRPPFIFKFEGLIQHRLIKITKNKIK